MDKESKQRIKRFLLVILGIVLFTLIFCIVFRYIYPFILAFLISMMLHPLVTSLESNWKIKRGIATFFVICTFFIITTTFGYFLIRRLLHELTELSVKLPSIIANFSHKVSDLEANVLPTFYQWFVKFFPIEKENEMKFSFFIFEKIKEYSTELLDHSLQIISELLTSAAYMFLVIFFIVISTYFITKDYRKIIILVKPYIPLRMNKLSLQISHFAKRSLLALVKAQMTIALLTAILSFSGFVFFRVEHLLVLSFVIFFVDLIPYLGIGIIYLPWILYSFLQEQYVFTIQLTILYIVIIIIRQIIEPRLLAKNLGIHPLITIIVLFITIKLFGALGVFFTPLILIIISSLYHAKLIQLLSEYIKKGYL